MPWPIFDTRQYNGLALVPLGAGGSSGRSINSADLRWRRRGLERDRYAAFGPVIDGRGSHNVRRPHSAYPSARAKAARTGPLDRQSARARDGLMERAWFSPRRRLDAAAWLFAGTGLYGRVPETVVGLRQSQIQRQGE